MEVAKLTFQKRGWPLPKSRGKQLGEKNNVVRAQEINRSGVAWICRFVLFDAAVFDLVIKLFTDDLVQVPDSRPPDSLSDRAPASTPAIR